MTRLEVQSPSPLPGRRRVWRIAAVLLLVAILAAIAGWFLDTDEYHFRVVQQGQLYRTGIKDADQFLEACNRSKARTVVTLLTQEELQNTDFKGAIDAAQQHGVKVVFIPVTQGVGPTLDEVYRFVELAANPANRPLLVHCQQGVRRTAKMVAAYQLAIMGYDRQQAIDAIEPFGRQEGSLEDIRGFIRSLDLDKLRRHAASGTTLPTAGTAETTAAQ